MIVGREYEINTLRKMLNSNSSELIAVYGRRRVGKTFLIREVYKKHIVFELTGYYKGNLRDQLQNFHAQLESSSTEFTNTKAPNNWFKAFKLLEEYLNSLKKLKRK